MRSPYTTLLRKIVERPEGAKVPVSQLARELNATVSVVFAMLERLVSMGRLDRMTLRLPPPVVEAKSARTPAANQWLPFEDAVVREHYTTIGGTGCARLLLPSVRSPNAIAQRACKLGVSNKPYASWSEGENAILAEHYPKEGSRCSARLKGRSEDCIRAQARRLGITGPGVGRPRRNTEGASGAEGEGVHTFAGSGSANGPISERERRTPDTAAPTIEQHECGGCAPPVYTPPPKPKGCLTFEQQLERVVRGEVRIGPALRIPRRGDPSGTLGGVSTAYDGPNS